MAEEPEPDAVSAEVSATLRSLVPARALTRALRPRSRAPGYLSWLWAQVSQEELGALVGFSAPRLPASAVQGLCERFAVPGRNGESHVQRDGTGHPVTSLFAIFYLPESLPWGSAMSSSVLYSESVAIYVVQADDRYGPAQRGRWAQELRPDGSSLDASAARDFAVVQVAGTAVGVQVDTSGAVSLGWSLRRTVGGASRRWNVELLVRAEPEAAVRLVHDAGLLT